MSKNKLVLFEGIDGSGKTTLAKALAKKIGGVYYHLPPKSILSINQYIRSLDPETRLQYYLLSNRVASSEIKKLLKKSHVCVDRYFYSTMAYYSFFCNRKIVKPDGLLQPDEIIYCHADWPQIIKRIAVRGATKFEKIKNLKKIEKIYSQNFKNIKKVIKLDTTSAKPSEALDILLKEIKF